MYGWYAWGYYREQRELLPFNREIFGRVLDLASGEGNKMSQWVLKANGEVIPKRSVRPLKLNELHCATNLKQRETFNSLIERRYGDITTPSNVSQSSQDDGAESWTPYHDEHVPPQHIPETEDVVDVNGRIICQQPAYNRLLNAEVQLQLGEKV